MAEDMKKISRLFYTLKCPHRSYQFIYMSNEHTYQKIRRLMDYSKIKKAVHSGLIQNAPHKWEDICLPADSLAPASFTISILIINFVFVELN